MTDDKAVVAPEPPLDTPEPIVEPSTPPVPTEPVTVPPEISPELPPVSSTLASPRSEPTDSTTGEPAEPFAPIPETPVQTTPEIQPEPVPEPSPTPPTPAPVEIPSPLISPTLTVSAPTSLPPQASDIKPQLSDTDFVAQLTENQLKLASALWTKKNQAAFSKKGIAKRKQTMELNLRQIVDYLSRNNGAPLPRIARHTNITAGTTSKYLRQLIASGKVRAEGWAKNRRYYLK